MTNASGNGKPSLLILAAGMGSRYGGLKQIAPVGPHGELIIEYSIFDALRSGFGNVVCVIRQDIESAFIEVVEKRLPDSVPLTYAYQALDDIPSPYTPPADRKKQWGTAHAVYAAREKLGEPFAVINADDFYGYESFRLLGEFLSGEGQTSMAFASVPFVLRNTLSEHGGVSRGLCRLDADKRLASVTECHGIRKEDGAVRSDSCEHSALTGDELVSMNMWGFNMSLFPVLGEELQKFLALSSTSPKAEFYIPEMIDQLITKGAATVKALVSPEQWYGVTYTEDKPAVETGIKKQIEAGRYPERLWG